MATSANRDVKLTLSVDTLGEEGVKALQDSILVLAKQGGAAAPEFQRLADEVARLGEQSTALSAFRQLADETAALTERQEQAQLSSRQLADRLEELRAATDSARLRQQSAADALLQNRNAITEVAAQIRLLKLEYDTAGRKTDEYKNKAAELVREQARLGVAANELRVAQRGANTELSAAEQAQKRAETAYNRSVASVERVNEALRRNTQETREAAEAAERLGVSTEDVAGSQARLVAALSAAGTEAQRLRDQNEALAASTAQAVAAERAAEQAREASVATMRDEVAALVALEASFEAMSRELQAYVAAAAKADNAAQWQREADAIVNTAEASRRLARETQINIEAQRELAAQRTFEKQAAEARELVKAAEYVRFWTDSLEQAEAQSKQLQGAFNALNVRSADQIQAELAQVRSALETVRAQATTTGQGLAGAFTAGEARIKALELELRQLNGTLTSGDRLAALFKNSLGQIAAGNLIADGVGFLVNKVKELGVAFVTTIAQTEQFRRGLTAIYKDTNLVQSQFEFLRKTANDAGVSVGSLQGAFVKFSAATKSANIPLSETNQLFAAVTGAAGSLGLNGEQVTGMLEALGQMASKGTVSMEELRQQLGDRLPGAFSLVAQGLGITEAQLVKLVESGKLAARDLFPALTKALGTMQGEVTGLTPAYERLKNSLTTVAQEAGDAAWTSVLTSGLKLLTAAVGIVGGALLGLSNILRVAGAAVAAFVAVLTGQASFNEALQDVRKSLDDAAASQAKFSDSIDAALDPSKKLAEATQQRSTAEAQAAVSTAQMAGALATTTEGLAAQKLQADLAAQSGASLSTTYNQLQVRLGEVSAALVVQAAAAEKQAKATQVEGQALMQLTQLRGDERAALEASVAVAQRNEEAQRRAAEANRALLEVLQVEYDAQLRKLQQGGVSIQQIEAETVAIRNKITAAQGEVAQADASAAASRNDVLVREIQRKAYEDNSAAVGRYEQSIIALEARIATLNQNTDGSVQANRELKQAENELTEATALRNDGLKDSIVKLQGEAAVKQANYNITLASLNVQQSAYERLAQAARASGELTQATYYEIEAKRVQIQVTIAVAQAKKAEADASYDAAKAELLQLTKTNSLTTEKRLEIDARLANARAKAIEAGASAEIVRALEAEISAIRAQANARGSNTGSIQADTAARYQNRDAINAQTAALEKQKLSSDGFKANADGSAAGTFNNSVPLDKIYEVLGRRQSLGVQDIEQVRAALTQATNAREYLESLKAMRASSVSGQAFFDTQTQETALRNILQSLEDEAARGEPPADTAGTTASRGTAAAAPSSGSSHTVKIDLGGRTRTINTASPSDATALVAMLQDLQTAAGRAS